MPYFRRRRQATQAAIAMAKGMAEAGPVVPAVRILVAKVSIQSIANLLGRS